MTKLWKWCSLGNDEDFYLADGIEKLTGQNLDDDEGLKMQMQQLAEKMSDESLRFSRIIGLNGKLLHQYDTESLRTLGTRVTDGWRTSVYLTHESHSYSELVIECKHSLANRSSWMVARCPLSKISYWECTVTNNVKADTDIADLGIPHNEEVISKLLVHVPTKYLVWAENPFGVKAILRRDGTMDQEMDRVRKAVAETYNEITKLTIVYREVASDAMNSFHREFQAYKLAAKTDPMGQFYEQYSKNAREIQVTKLREKIPDRSRPIRPANFFYSKDHYNTLQAFSQIGEYDAKTIMNEFNRERPTSIRPVMVPGYSVNGFQVGYFFVATDPWAYDRMPAIGENFKLKLLTKWTAPMAPQEHMGPSFLKQEMVSYLWQRFSAAVHQLSKDKRTLLTTLAKILADVWTVTTSPSLDELEQHAKKLLRNAAEREKQEDGSWVTKKPAEDLEAYRTRFEADIGELMPNLHRAAITSGKEITLTATRIQAPPGLERVDVVFLAEIPHAEGWPKEAGPRPYVNVELPTAVASKDIIHETFTARGGLQCLIDRSEPLTTLRVRVNALNELKKNGGILGDWILRFDKIKESDMRNHLETFPALKAVAEMLDGRAPRNIEEEALFAVAKPFLDEQRRAFQNLKRSPFGLWLLNGCPGAGKTFLGSIIVSLIAAGGQNETVFNSAPTKLTEGKECSWPSDETSAELHRDDREADPEDFAEHSDLGEAKEMGVPTDIPTNAAERTPTITERSVRARILVAGSQNKQCDDLAKTLEKQLANLGKPEAVITRINVMAREMRHIKRMGQENTAPEIDGLHGMMLAEAEFQLLNIAREARAEKLTPMLHGGDRSLSERVAHLVRSDPAYSELKELIASREKDPQAWEQNPGVISEHFRAAVTQILNMSDIIIGTPVACSQLFTAYPGTCDFAAVLTEEAGRMDECDQLAIWQAAPVATLRMCTGDVNQIGPFSTSTLHKKVDDDSKVRKANPITARVKEEVDPKGRDKYLKSSKPFQTSRGLVDNTLGKANVEEPDLPVNASAQITTSMFMRMVRAGVDVNHLLVNRRARGGTAEYASSQFYGGDMLELEDPANMSDVTCHIRDAIRYIGRGSTVGSNLLIDMLDSGETRMGLSKQNEGHARLIVAIVRSLFAINVCGELPTETTPGKRAKILILSPYSAQVQLIKKELWLMNKDEVRMDDVEVRTVTAAMGLEADIVITDFTSAEKPGFVGQKELVCVATTRARYGNIYIIHPPAAKSAHLRQLLHDADRRGHKETEPGFKWYKYINSMCHMCFGSHKPFCKKEDYKCPVCGKTGHSARRCRKRHTLEPLSVEVTMEQLSNTFGKWVKNTPETEISTKMTEMD